MGKFTSQGKSYGAPPSGWALAGSELGGAIKTGMLTGMERDYQ